MFLIETGSTTNRGFYSLYLVDKSTTPRHNYYLLEVWINIRSVPVLLEILTFKKYFHAQSRIERIIDKNKPIHRYNKFGLAERKITCPE